MKTIEEENETKVTVSVILDWSPLNRKLRIVCVLIQEDNHWTIWAQGEPRTKQEDFMYEKSCPAEYFFLAHSSPYFIIQHGCQEMHRAPEHGTEICQSKELRHTLVIPCRDISRAICGPLQDSCRCIFLGEFTGPSWHGPLSLPGPPFIPTTIFKTAGIQSKH